MYNFFQFLHVTAAIVWLGSGVGLVALIAVMTRSGDTSTVMAVNKHFEVLGPRLFGTAAMSTLLFGVLMVLVSDSIEFTDTWIIVGLVGVAISLVIVGVQNGIRKKLMAAIEQHGPEHPDAQAAMSSTRRLNYIDLVVLFVVVAAMVTQRG